MSVYEKESRKIRTMVLTALLMALILVLTFATKIPIPASQGYIHLGDCMIFMAVIILGRKYGTAAAAVGSALADIMGGYAFYAPVSFVVKGAMAFILATFLAWALEKGKAHAMVLAAAGMLLAGAVMVAGYYLAESLFYGNLLTPLAGAGMNTLQFIVGMAIALPLAGALCKTPAGKDFAFRINQGGQGGRTATALK